MSFHRETGKQVLPDHLSSAAVIATTGAFILLIALLWKPGKHHRLVVFAPISVALSARVWSLIVSHFVPEPYLDEYFHIPQAQKYCEGRYNEWDDKITTPPGLNAVFGALTGFYGCDAASLRAVNALALTALVFLAMLCRREIEARLHEVHSRTRVTEVSQYAAHTALNVALFPTLFFFGGLYYTDVLSTVAVLAAFLHSLRRLRRDANPAWSDALSVLLGVAALFMRQTNVFWVVVFLGGIEAVHAVKTLRPPRVDKPMTSHVVEHAKFVLWRYSVGDVHDPPLSQGAGPEDMIYVAISLCVAAICNLPRVLRQVWPHITVLVAFAGFVVWNGGVVLGDKSNHIATIHLAQMLYIWAFFSFFSLPLLVPYALPIVNSLFRMTRFVLSIPDRTVVNPAASKSRKTKKSDGKPGVQGRPSWRLSQIYFFYFSELVTTLYYICTLVLSAVIIKLNTIIHPFTLADNRHYMFYVFRYTIRRAPWIRYSLIVIYSIGRWLIWDTLAGCRASTRPEYAGICSKYYYLADNPSPYTNHPLFLSGRGRARQVDDRYPAEASKTSAALSSPAQSAEDVALEQDPLRQSVEPVSVSTGLIFLLATSLSLVTAPLVEPRYFIVPWVMWRLLIPAWRLHDHDPEQGVLSYMRPDSSFGKPVKSLQRYDVRLILETVWFLAINAFTGYIFLFKPYIWKAEDGTVLDGGRLQRFLW